MQLVKATDVILTPGGGQGNILCFASISMPPFERVRERESILFISTALPGVTLCFCRFLGRYLGIEVMFTHVVTHELKAARPIITANLITHKYFQITSVLRERGKGGGDKKEISEH